MIIVNSLCVLKGGEGRGSVEEMDFFFSKIEKFQMVKKKEEKKKIL